MYITDSLKENFSILKQDFVLNNLNLNCNDCCGDMFLKDPDVSCVVEYENYMEKYSNLIEYLKSNINYFLEYNMDIGKLEDYSVIINTENMGCFHLTMKDFS